MLSRIPIAYIDIRVFAHATEDTDKVLKAAYNIIPAELREVVVFKKTNQSGYYGNPITLFEARIKDKEAVQQLFQKLCSSLSMMDKESLNSEIKQHLEKGNLYLRLDKQSAYLEKLRLLQSDPIHFRIHFKKHGSEEVISICREAGLLP